MAKEYYQTKNKRSLWLCDCDCGKKNIVVYASNLLSGKSTSCGCNRHINRQKRINTYDLSGDFGVGYTENCEEFYFDLEDFDKIKKYSWHTDKAGYICANERYYQNDELKNKTVKMHRIVMGVTDPQKQVDHIFHQVNDNRKSQLRIVSPFENAANKRALNSNTSGVCGVNYVHKMKQWRAYIGLNNKQKHLGYFKKLEDAINARRMAEIKYFGEYRYIGESDE